MRYHYIRKAGPYKVHSLADGRLEITPDWPQFPKYNDRDGGGPGLFSRLGLAEEIQDLLNKKTEHFAKEAKG